MKKTYCLVSAQYLPTMGGVENFTFNLAKELIKNGNKCIVITSSIKNLKNHEIDENGIEIIRLDSFNFLNNRFPFVKPTKSNSNVLKNLLKYDNLNFIINTRIYPLSIYASFFAKKYKKPAILIDHSTNYLSLGNKFLDFLIKIYEHIVAFFLKLTSVEFYGVSKATCKWLSKFNITPKGIIYNSIDFVKINNVEKTYLDLSRYDINEDSIIISYVGRLIPEKGVENLYYAMKELNLKNVYLFFAGEGSSYNFLNNNQTDNIFVLGRLNFNEVISLFKQSNIFCFPTAYPEGFPTTVLEACACQCYTITTELSGGATELISDSNYGTIIKDNKVETIKDSILKSLNDSNLKTKALNAQQRVFDNYTWEKTAEKIENLNL